MGAPPMMSNGFLGDCSVADLLSLSLKFTEEKGVSTLKDADNVSLVFHFLKHLWTSLTEASLYRSTRDVKSGEEVIPFIYSDVSRKEVANRILQFLSHFREESSDSSEGSTKILTNIAQGHLLTCFKLICAFLLSRNDGDKTLFRLSRAVLCFIDVFMNLVPHAIDLSTFVDLLTELVRTLPPESTKLFADYIYQRIDFFNNSLRLLSGSAATARLVQTSGAKLIGLIRILETRLRDLPADEVASRVFNLRIMLTSCLPMSHLGVCNRQSLRADYTSVSPVPQEEWNRLIGLSVRKKPQGISQFEIINYESAAVVSGFSHSMSGQVFDMKSYVGRNDTRADTSDTPVLPPYNVYCHYCDLLNFIYRPEVVADKSLEYLEELQNKLTTVASFISNISEKSGQKDPALPWAMEQNGCATQFISMCTRMCFWEGFLCSMALALQTIKLSHKRTQTPETIYSSLKEKMAGCIDTMEKTLYQCGSKNPSFSARMDRLLCREKEWVLWKQKGCPQGPPEPASDDVLTSPEMQNPGEEDEDEGEMHDFLNVLEQLEHISPKGHNGLPEIGSNCTLVVDDLRFDRQSEAWYLPKKEQERPVSTAYDKLCAKLCDYIEKVKMDEDPVNDIEESERSKHDPLFRFRFNRLFTTKHLEKYMELTNEKLEAGNIESLIDSMKTTPKSNNKKVRKKNKS